MDLINKGNAKIIQETSFPVINLALLRYKSLFDLYSEEPYCIYVKTRKNSRMQEYEQVLRIRKWIPNNCAYALYLYATDRTLAEGHLMIRRVFWDRKRDMDMLMHADRETLEKQRAAWPSMEAESLFLRREHAADIIKTVAQLDDAMSNGIELKSRTQYDERNALDTEIMRRFCWGELKGTWNWERYNSRIEEILILLEQIMKSHFECRYPPIYQMSFDYCSLPEEMKRCVTGEKGIREP